MWDIVYSLNNAVLYAFTHANKIHYFFSVPEEINFEESLTTMHNFFMNPYYNIDIIKQEIQSINSESTQKNNYFEIVGNQIITDLSNEKTSFHGYGMGNNQTIDISQVEKIKKILVGNAQRAYDPKKLIYKSIGMINGVDLKKGQKI
jgi:secreted Zn-dependent insulinase-like peptidase